MPSGKFEIIIAGGGISGAAIALFLSHLNTDITILESRPSRTTSAEGGILMLAPNGMHVLNGLDLAHKLLQRDSGIQVPCITINDSAGGLIGKMPHGSVERYGFASTMVMRWDIHEVLLDEVERKCLNVRWNAQVNATEEFDDGIIVHWTEHGLPEHKKVDLLIGADGIWSAARLSMLKSLGLSAPELTYGGLVSMGPWALFSTLTAFLGFGFLSLERACVMIQGRQGFIGMALFDKQGKKVAWWTSLERNGGYRRNKREVRERYSDWAFPVPQLIAAAETSGDQPFVWPVFEMEKLGHWHSKRTVLVGDAAHAIPPHSGQGASQSLEDVGYLSHPLRQYLEKKLFNSGIRCRRLDAHTGRLSSRSTASG